MNLQNITNIATSINDNNWVTISAISTVVLALVAIYSLYFNLKLWRSQDKPWLNFKIKYEQTNMVATKNPNINSNNLSSNF